MIRPRLVIGFAEAVRRGGDSWRHEFEDAFFCMGLREFRQDEMESATMKMCMRGQPYHDIRDRLSCASYEYLVGLRP